MVSEQALMVAAGWHDSQRRHGLYATQLRKLDLACTEIENDLARAVRSGNEPRQQRLQTLLDRQYLRRQEVYRLEQASLAAHNQREDAKALGFKAATERAKKFRSAATKSD